MRCHPHKGALSVRVWSDIGTLVMGTLDIDTLDIDTLDIDTLVTQLLSCSFNQLISKAI